MSWLSLLGGSLSEQHTGEVEAAVAPRSAFHSDAEAIEWYITRRVVNANTRQSVQLALARLAWYMHKNGLVTLSAIGYKEAMAFRDWLATPASSHSLEDIGPAGALLDESGNPNPYWRPIKPGHAPTPATVNLAISNISGLFEWLVHRSHISANPFRAIEKTNDGYEHGDTFEDAPYHKALGAKTTLELFRFLAEKRFDVSERQAAADRWLITLLFWTAHRVTALTQLTLGHLHEVDGGWELRIVGKRKSKLVQPFPDFLWRGMERYRLALGMSWPPKSEESRLLYGGTRLTMGKQQPLTARAIQKQVARIGQQAARAIAKNSPDLVSNDQLAKLSQLEPHTLRHTYCSTAINVWKVPVAEVMRHMGHKSVATTALYQSVVSFGDFDVDPEIYRTEIIGLSK